MGAISDKGILLLLCACHLYDKWSYCGQCCTVSVAFVRAISVKTEHGLFVRCINKSPLSDLFILALEYLHRCV